MSYVITSAMPKPCPRSLEDVTCELCSETLRGYKIVRVKVWGSGKERSATYHATCAWGQKRARVVDRNPVVPRVVTALPIKKEKKTEVDWNWVTRHTRRVLRGVDKC